MASSTVPPQRLLALLALAVLSCLQLALPAAASLGHALPRPVATTATPLEAGGKEEDGAGGLARRSCWYTVKVKTSCASPRRSPDAVSLAFGDAYRNEVYVAALTPEYGFERCATDTFKVTGPCGYGVCYLYLRRAGRVCWAPEWVQVYEPTSGTPSTFRYGDPLPSGVWYGFNRCPRRPPPPPPLLMLWPRHCDGGCVWLRMVDGAEHQASRCSAPCLREIIS